MMKLPTKYNPQTVEDKWYKHWLQHNFFRSKPNPKKTPYAMIIPPPNVTGILHMGHILNNTIQDVLVRKARMEGKEACWVPGTDHASIATEAKVVALLKEKGIKKSDLSREAFLKHAWTWKEKYGGIILEQLKKIGASCDWERTRFTLEESLSEAVNTVFIKLYEKGYIYRGNRMVNWDPQGKTALADDEVIYKEVTSPLYYLRYALVGDDDYVTIATTRPETILGDTALCIHPKDLRYQHLKGKKAFVPLINRPIPIIEDEYVAMDFGTGCLKVTPAHDVNDYELGQKHQLALIDIFKEDGTLSEAAQLYGGEDRFVVREKIVKQLKEAGHLLKTENYKNRVGFSERTDAVVEPRISTQWFVKIKELAKPALENVLNDTIQFHPPKFKNIYKSWLEKVKDWCISRQLWWGHRIPAYYLPDGTVVVAKNKQEALAKVTTRNESLTEKDLKQDEDVLDTWFSSWLWPLTVFDGLKDPDNEDICYYYPTHDLVTAPEIIFFWVARMIMAGYEFRGEAPFRNVYFTGIVRDKLGRKMAKSLGNSPDPLTLIEQYGADGVRTGMLFSSPAGNDLLFDTKLCEQGRNFANKIWNAFRLIKSWETSAQVDDKEIAIQWFEAKFYQMLQEVEVHFQQFRISDALITIYKLIWDDFCAWYLEMIKPRYGQPIAKHTYEATLAFFESLMKLLHPFMPFITEEIWHHLKNRNEKDCLIVAAWPQQQALDESLLNQAKFAFEVIASIRNIRNKKQIAPQQKLKLYLRQEIPQWLASFACYIKKLAQVNHIVPNSTEEVNGIGFSVNRCECFVPLVEKVDQEKEKMHLLKELTYTKGFLTSIMKKLNNERFIQNAPGKVIAMEQKKKEDAVLKIKMLEESLAKL